MFLLPVNLTAIYGNMSKEVFLSNIYFEQLEQFRDYKLTGNLKYLAKNVVLE